LDITWDSGHDGGWLPDQVLKPWLKNKHQIWYENLIKLNNETKLPKKIIKKKTQNKRICNHKNEYQIKKKELKSND